MLSDSSDRTIRHIRMSVAGRCQFRCDYCLPEEGVPLLDGGDIVRYEETLAFVRVAVEEGISGAQATVGGPLLRRGIVSDDDGVTRELPIAVSGG
jgi:GTP 3',8-cyclase